MKINKFYPSSPQLKTALKRALSDGVQLSIQDIGFTDTLYQEPCMGEKYPYSRWNSQIDLSGYVTKKTKLALPIISSSMPGVTSIDVARLLISKGGLAVMPRNLQYNEIRKIIQELYNEEITPDIKKKATLDKKERLKIAAAVGVLPRSGSNPRKMVEDLIQLGIEIIFIEMQQANSQLGFEFCRKLRIDYPELELVLGNFNNADGVKRALDCGVNAVKVGIGTGDACLTSPMSGITKGQVNTVFEIAAALEDSKAIPVIIDGGTNTPGGAAILLTVIGGYGAVTLGSKIAATWESSAQKQPLHLNPTDKTVAIIEGHGSEAVAMQNKEPPERRILEGKVINREVSGHLLELLLKYEGGFRTAMFGYHGAKNWQELQKKTTISINSSANAFERWFRHDSSF